MTLDGNTLMKVQRTTLSLLVSTATLVAIQTACSNDFEGAGVGPAAPQPATQVSPKEADTNGETSKPTTPTPPAEVCSLENKAARIYFVVDNSNSHGYVVEGETLRRGTDPAGCDHAWADPADYPGADFVDQSGYGSGPGAFPGV